MTLELDPRTIAVTFGIVSAFLGTSMIYTALRRRIYPGFTEWTVAFFLGGAGVVLISLRGLVPDLLGFVLADLLVVVLFVLIGRGLIRFTGGRASLPVDASFLVPATVLLIYGSYVHPSAVFRDASLSSVLAVASLRCARLSLRGFPAVLGARDWMLTGLFLGTGCVFVLRVGLLVGVDPAVVRPGVLSGPHSAAFLLALVVLIIGIEIGLLLATIRRMEQSVVHSQERYRRLVEDLREDYTIFSHDAQGTFTYVSPSAEEVFGAPPEVVVGRNWRELVHASAEMIERVERADAFCMEGIVPPPCELVYRHPKRGECALEIQKRPVLDRFGEVSAIEGIAKDTTYRRRMEMELQRLATTDPLTGALNRRAFVHRAAEEISRSARYDIPLTFLMLDVDHFKQVNDTHGHETGDAVLRSLAETCKEAVRPSDVVCRMGGEEFAVLLTQTDGQGGRQAAERLRRRIAERVSVDREPGIRITVSIGVTERREEETSLDDILRRADGALYRAKEGGRNRVEAA